MDTTKAWLDELLILLGGPGAAAEVIRQAREDSKVEDLLAQLSAVTDEKVSLEARLNTMAERQAARRKKWLEEKEKLEFEIAELSEYLTEGVVSEMVRSVKHPHGYTFKEMLTSLKDRAHTMKMVYEVTLMREAELEANNKALWAQIEMLRALVPLEAAKEIAELHPEKEMF